MEGSNPRDDINVQTQNKPTMSSSLSSLRQNDKAVGSERNRGEFTEALGGMDNGSQETGFRGKLRRFWQRTRIPSVMKKVMEGSKTFLSRLNPRPTPRFPSPDAAQNGAKNGSPRREVVKFPEDMFPSPASSSNEDTLSPSNLSRTPLNIDLDSSVPKTVPKATLAPHQAVTDPVTAEPRNASEIAGERSFCDVRYKEKVGKQKRFPEIKLGVVSRRVKWLEPFMSGEKDEDPAAHGRSNGIGGDVSGGEEKREPHALEKHSLSALAPTTDGVEIAGNPDSLESDEEFGFDDSPRLYKHRLPEEEPKPWVEPGTVAKGAMWLHPVLSGSKHTGSGDSDPGNLTSPTRIKHVEFR